MKLRSFLSIAVVLAGIFVGAPRAMATTNLFVPISGAQFNINNYTYPGPVTHGSGVVFNSNTCTGCTVDVLASLGHAAGGSNSFVVYGFGTGALFECRIMAISAVTGQTIPSAATSTASGAFTMTVPTNVPSGDWFYSIMCILPPGGGVHGVKPNS